MKKLIQLGLVMALSTGSFMGTSYALDEVEKDEVAAIENKWGGLKNQATETHAAMTDENSKNRESLAKLNQELNAIKKSTLENDKKIAFFSKMIEASHKYGPIHELCGDVKANKLKGVDATDFGDLISALHGYNAQMFRDEAPVAVGQNIVIPGIHVSALTDKYVAEISHTREEGVSYFTLTNGHSGKNGVSDSVEIEGEYGVVVFPGSRRSPDGTTLILRPQPRDFDPKKQKTFFTDLTSERTTPEKAQVNFKGQSPEYTLTHSLADGWSVSVSIPRSIMTSLGVLHTYGQEVEDIRSLGSVYDSLVRGVDELEARLGAAQEKIEQFAASYEKKAEEIEAVEEEH